MTVKVSVPPSATVFADTGSMTGGTFTFAPTLTSVVFRAAAKESSAFQLNVMSEPFCAVVGVNTKLLVNVVPTFAAVP